MSTPPHAPSTVTSGLKDPRFIRMGWHTMSPDLEAQPTDTTRVGRHLLPHDMLVNNDVRVGRFTLHRELWQQPAP